VIAWVRRILGIREPLGRRGERHAAAWLRRRGYRILERNRVMGRGEADLIALAPDGLTIVIVEVKTRSSEAPPPEQQLNERKRFHMIRLAARLQRSARYRARPIRLDAIAIVWPESQTPQVRHYPAVFESPI
jgi:putative endonuclease